MTEQEYIQIESIIRKDRFGTEKTEPFKIDLWEDYYINVDTLPKTQIYKILENPNNKIH